MNGRWQECSRHQTGLQIFSFLGCKFWVEEMVGNCGSVICVVSLGFTLQSPSKKKKKGSRRETLQIHRAAVPLVKNNIFTRKVTAGHGPYPALRLTTPSFISTARARPCCTGETVWASLEPPPPRRWPVRQLWNVLPKYTIANALQSRQPHAALGDTPSVSATLRPFIRHQSAPSAGGLG